MKPAKITWLDQVIKKMKSEPMKNEPDRFFCNPKNESFWVKTFGLGKESTAERRGGKRG